MYYNLIHEEDPGYWGELQAVPVNPRFPEAVSHVVFDQQHELVWAGTPSGMLHTLQSPQLSRYASFRAHSSSILGMVPLGDCMLSVSEDTVAVHSCGGAPRLTVRQQEASDGKQRDSWLSCALQPGQAHNRALLGCQSGSITVHDMAVNKAVGSSEVWGDAVAFMTAPEGARGMLAVGSPTGRIAVVDARRTFKAEQSSIAHPGGLSALVMRGDLLASCGYTMRMGQPVMDSTVRVFDLRYGLRPLFTVPFMAPIALAWHPHYSMTLLAASPAGMATLVDVQSPAGAHNFQLDTGGDMLACCAVAPSGEALAFGGSGGYVHLWASTQEPNIVGAGAGVPLTPPPTAPPRPAVRLHEDDSFSAVPQHYAAGKLLSDFSAYETMQVGLPPHVIDPSLKKDMKQVDFVGYIPNPFFSRSKPFGQATREVAALRDKRLPMATDKARDLEAERAGRASQRAAAGGVVLPARYSRTEIRAQSSVRFEEFDFSYYNRTRFAGLENDLPNCYCNALLQVLYFTPQFREAILEHSPEPDMEFCLSCEMLFLFRMMLTARGTPCRASNLLRALRQVREAAALGLLEGTGLRGAGDSRGVEAEVAKQAALPRRITTLCRFLLDHLHKEARGEEAGGKPASAASNDSKPGSTASGDSKPASAASGDSKLARCVESLFGLRYRQRLVALSGKRGERSREARTFQIDLQYPSKVSSGSSIPKVAASPLASPIKAPAGRAAASPVKDSSSAPNAATNSPSSPSTSPAKDGQQPSPAASGPGRPSFAELLASSLRATTELRAWFDETAGYQWVRSSRVPLSLPKALLINCAMTDASDLALWQPTVQEEQLPDGSTRSVEQPWLPWALSVEAQPDDNEVVVREAESVDLLGPAAAAPVAARYELTAVICHVHDHDDFEAPTTSATVPGSPSPMPAPAGAVGGAASEGAPAPPGHLVAIIKVQRPYLDEDVGIFASNGAAAAGHLQTSSSGRLLTSLRRRSSSGAGPAAAAPPPPARTSSYTLPDTLDDVFEGLVLSTVAEAEPPLPTSSNGSSGAEEGPSKDKPGAAERDSVTQPPAAQLPAAQALSRTGTGSMSLGVQSDWVVFNDFVITPVGAADVMQLYGNQKLPCLLVYTQVEELAACERLPPPRPAPPLLPQQFAALCAAPPLQGQGSRGMARPTFKPLDMKTEAPGPNMLVAIDAEFVALSRPETTFEDGQELSVKPSRLGLARVSVLRGGGPKAGSCCIDDYVRATEPVHDYLTRFSGILPGDLDPSTSSRYLVTLKVAYLKLRYLVDCGVTFVGHGLKQDFRMLNLTVPPQQVVDTVELFSLRRKRKFSLRFLASYLLGISIQGATHDSIEDARTALKLYREYQRLKDEGTFNDKLAEMYNWGRMHGWDPVVLVNGRPSPAGSTAQQ